MSIAAPPSEIAVPGEATVLGEIAVPGGPRSGPESSSCAAVGVV
ncbi:hypothetical protein FB384_003098 [Prauserella sediminis]|uniref:Uncharacterized protein n=1 Tax=Prauserella sediminis TaxID=577680 RepID=A0A839XRX4_9PSEU|nr:hypothetical protein [Prauserella sediminis]MBB3664194.1 hypothetical protein [Prauserella sediminis]